MPDRQLMVIVPDWMQVFIDYIRDHKLPQDKALTEQVTRRSKSYVLVGDKLYQHDASSRVLSMYKLYLHHLEYTHGRKRNPRRNPCRVLWQSRRLQNTSWQGF